MYQVKSHRIIKARQYLNKQGLISLYYSSIHPYLTYCNIWGITYKTSLKRLTTLQNKAIRIIAHARWGASCDPIYKNLNMMKSTHINTNFIGRFKYCMYIGMAPESLTYLVKKNSNIHAYSTRIANLYHAPPEKLNLSKPWINYRGATIWNLIALEEINLENSDQNDKQWYFLKCAVSCNHHQIIMTCAPFCYYAYDHIYVQHLWSP